MGNKKSFPIVTTSREEGRSFVKTRNYSDTELEFAHTSAVAALCLVEWGRGLWGNQRRCDGGLWQGSDVASRLNNIDDLANQILQLVRLNESASMLFVR